MPTFSSKIIALIVFTSFVCLTTSYGAVKIKFRVTDDAKNVLKGMTVRLYMKNEIVEEIEHAGSLVSFELEEQSIYTIEVVLKGFITKRISVVTELLSDNQSLDDAYKFNLRLERASNYSELDGSEDVLEYPSAIIEFDTNSGLFDYNSTYLLSTEKAYREMIENNREIKF